MMNMTYSATMPVNSISYTPSNFEAKAFNAIEKSCNSIKNTFNYISNITFPENKSGWLVLDKHDIAYDNLHTENLNTRGHLLHLVDIQKEMYAQPEVKGYVKYLKSKGYKLSEVAGHKILNYKRGGMIAGVNVDNKLSKSVLVMGTDFFRSISREARAHGVSHEAKKRHTVLHETTHMIKSYGNMLYHMIYGKYPFPAEKFAEKHVHEYAVKMAKSAKTEEEKKVWEDVAHIAKYRYENVKRICSKRNSGKHKEENIEEKVEANENSIKKESIKEKSNSKNQKYEGKEKNSEKESKENNSEEANSDLEARVENSESNEAAQGEEACEGESSAEGGE